MSGNEKQSTTTNRPNCAQCKQGLMVSAETTITVEDGSQLIRCSRCGAFTTIPPESALPFEK